MKPSLADQAEHAIGLVVEAACPLCKVELRAMTSAPVVHAAGAAHQPETDGMSPRPPRRTRALRVMK
jgi:hypothetical protein